MLLAHCQLGQEVLRTVGELEKHLEVLVGDLDFGVSLQELDEGDLALHQGQVLADACPRTSAEAPEDEVGNVLALVLPPQGTELKGFCEIFFIKMIAYGHYGDSCVFSDGNTIQIVIILCNSSK